MSDNDIRQLAARYLGHLMSTPASRAEFASIDKTNPAAVASLIQKHLNLPTTPSTSDVAGVFKHAEELTKPFLSAIKEHAPEYYEMTLAGVLLCTTSH
ncbi:hypothetical protein EPN44_12960 [bacterium]|nr:MAG: hypothetical protein EPN44_12960 [bacterium]